ncbi:MAG TPA: hypothetical protein VFL83_19950 [Anaeromyxobacter sp.]|nr:hypothetical protein [Anaeromyxobacter sp.]
MDHPVRPRTIHVTAARSRLAVARDVAIILVCAALLLATLAGLVASPPSPRPPPPDPAPRGAATVSL